MSTWSAEATARTAGRADAAAIEGLTGRDRVSRCEVHGGGPHGVSVRLAVEADTVAAAYEAALAFLATRLLPLLDGADLTDMRILPCAPPVTTGPAEAPRRHAEVTPTR